MAVIIPNTFVPGTVISADDVNENFTTVATAIDDNLPRNGMEAMTGQLQIIAGSASAPGIAFSSDTNTGMYRVAADEVGFATGGTMRMSLSSAGMTLGTALAVAYGGTGAATLTGLLQGNGTGAITGSATINNGNWSGTDLAVANGGTGASTEADARTNLGVAVAALEFIIDGGGLAIATGIKGDLEIPFACTVTRATMLADQAGGIVVDVWVDTYANYPPTDADSITAAAPPTIAALNSKSQDTTLSGWTTSLAAGSIMRFNVDSATSVTRCTISLLVTRA